MKVKTKVEIVAGFLSAGKTTFIEALLQNTVVEGEKVVILQCEKGNRKIQEEGYNQLGVVFKQHSPQLPLTIGDIKNCLERYNPHRIIIEYNGCRQLAELLCQLDEKGGEAICKIEGIYTVLNAATYKNYIVNFGEMLIDPIYSSDLILLNNCKQVGKEELKNILFELEKINSNAFLLEVPENGKIAMYLKEKKIFSGRALKGLVIRLKNLL